MAKRKSKTVQCGDTVKLRAAARSYTGGHIPAYHFARYFTVGKLTGNRAELYLGGMKTAEVNVHELILVRRNETEGAVHD